MPIIKSAIKRARQSERRRQQLVPYRTRLKTMMRKVSDLVKEGKKAEAVTLLPQVYKSIDLATKKQILHRNNAARKKSLMARLVSSK